MARVSSRPSPSSPRDGSSFPPSPPPDPHLPGGPLPSPSSGPSVVLATQEVHSAPASPQASMPRLLARGDCSRSTPPVSPAVRPDPPLFGQPRLKSIMVVPSTEASQCSDQEEGWSTYQSWKSRREASRSLGKGMQEQRSDRRHGFNAAGKEAFLSQFKGLCFRCLSSLHRRKDCRDPLRCIICKLPGHFGWECPQNPKNHARDGTAKERLGPLPPRPAAHLRLSFPPPAPAVAADCGMEASHHTDPARRPRSSHKVVISTPAMESRFVVLRTHVIVLTTMDPLHAANPMSVGLALERQLHVPAHLVRVTDHHPEDFLVHFDPPAFRDNALRLGTLLVDNNTFSIKPWHEDDHAARGNFNLHVRVVIEDLPQQLWTLEGAEEALGDKCRVDRLDSRTYERGHTKLFACWAWVWDVAHIPTRRTLWVMQRGAGRVVEMLGFSPPSRDVAPPPGVTRYDLLVHVDRVEDWTLLSPRSSHSPQSGLPSSSSDEDNRPFPKIFPGTWTRKVEDGQGPGRRQQPPVVSTGCHGMPFAGTRRNQDGDDKGGSRRSWTDALLGRSRATKEPAPRHEEAPQRRRRSHTPSSRRHGGHRGRGRFGGGTSNSEHLAHVAPPAPLPRQGSPDPIAEFFTREAMPLPSPEKVDCMALEIESAMAASLRALLTFNDQDEGQLHATVDMHAAFAIHGKAAAHREDMPPAAPPAAAQEGVHACRTPAPSATVETQLGAVTSRV